ncbi:predicted protein [Arabidopsis lyrata subsp. lyrata]|uniref:Predicted protein n=1 Tax=Arabidopsis lyrata subsp. lyrata TaxID=81972 RepID=D7M2D8_ARALL|nr:predicted protein [Arabidopsis lyrata subsp. lyrata]
MIELGPSRGHVDVEKWIANAVDRRVRELGLKIAWSAGPASLSKSLYTLHNEGIEGSLVIDSLALKQIFYRDYSGDSCSIENKTCFDKAAIDFFSYPDDKFMRSISSVTNLELDLSVATAAWCNAINFSQLIECTVTLLAELDWLESLMGLLQNSPILEVLFIDQTFIRFEEDFSLSWNEPSFVPGCFAAHLKIFEWKGYIGRHKEKEAIKYIFANSNCLERVQVSMESTCKLKDREKMMKELESMSRVSTSSQLLFSTQLEFPSFLNEID